MPSEYKFKNVPLNDAKVWDLFARGDTLGVFQLEKQLGQDWSRKMQPENIEELAALVSILRPGSLESGMAELLVDRKHGKKPVEYLHPLLEPILAETQGTLTYQEQSIRIATDIAGFSEEEADQLRKAIGKKKPELMAKLKKDFVEGCESHSGLIPEISNEIFGWIEKSQRYSFNKSHAVCYAFNAYFSAYQKVHYPTQFYTVWLNYSESKPDPKQEVYNLVQNAKQNGIDINPPLLSSKQKDFYVAGEKSIGFGLKHIRGVGAKSIEKFEKISKYISSFDGFLKYVKKIGRGCAESLIKAGACDEYELSRTYMLSCLHVVYGDSVSKDKVNSKLSDKEFNFFQDIVDAVGVISALELILKNDVSMKARRPMIQAKIEYLQSMREIKDTVDQKSIWEKLYLGINVSCSAIDDKVKWGSNLITCKDYLDLDDKDEFTVYGVIDNIIHRKTGPKSKNPGSAYCYITLSDHTGAIPNLVAWPTTFDQYSDWIKENACVGIEARKQTWNDRAQFPVKSIRNV